MKFIKLLNRRILHGFNDSFSYEFRTENECEMRLSNINSITVKFGNTEVSDYDMYFVIINYDPEKNWFYQYAETKDLNEAEKKANDLKKLLEQDK